ncbi:MAG: hypothetical protein HZB24_07340 [Desulfobacterales bacterium]|nr:hypothetical protein [Desulfobacterales bacterium]
MKQLIRTLALIGVALWMPINASALESAVHGYLESRGVFRDTSGFQYGFMDDMYGVQWIQELQLDVELKPTYQSLKPPVRLEKTFFRYRGAYDAIYDLTDRYDNIQEDSIGKFKPGSRDLQWDQDLREAFADIVMENPGGFRSNFRLGKQIVQWGEADVFNLINIVNPNDLYNKAFFSPPEQLLAPLWMGRYDITVPLSGLLTDINLQLLAIPDIRPHVFAPPGAPYAAIPAPYVHDTEASTFENSELGARFGWTTVSGSYYLYYFDGYQAAPAVDVSTLVDGYLTLRHPSQETMGYSFARFIDTGNFVFRGEGSMTTDKTLGDGTDPAGRGYSEHDFYQVLFGLDKTLPGEWVGTASGLTTAVQVYYAKIADWDHNPAVGRTAPEEDWRGTLLLTTDYMNGRITPTISLMYDSEEAWLTYFQLKWSPHGTWYTAMDLAALWGDAEGYGDYNPYIDTQSEVQLKFGYQW